MGNVHTREDLKYYQSLPLNLKIAMSKRRIRDFIREYGESGVYIAFSGGKDSTVLLNLVREEFPKVEAVFCDTGLEYPAIRKFVNTQKNTTKIKPSLDFRNVLIQYGYPIISKEVANNIDGARRYIKILTDRQTDRQTDPGFRIPTTKEEYVELANTLKKDWGKVKGSPQRLAIFLSMRGKTEKVIIPSNVEDRSNYSMEKYKFLLDAPFIISDRCCTEMKKKPSRDYGRKFDKKPIIGTLAVESRLRTQEWIQHGCNSFKSENPESKPLSFWTENDILQYLKEKNIEIAEPYGKIIIKNDGIEGQANVYDLFNNYEGAQYDTSGVKRTGCIFCMFGITKDTKRFINLQKREPALCDYVLKGGAFDKDGMWKPDNRGLGFWFVIKWLNVHGNLGIELPNEKEYIEKYGTEETAKHLVTDELKTS